MTESVQNATWILTEADIKNRPVKRSSNLVRAGLAAGIAVGLTIAATGSGIGGGSTGQGFDGCVPSTTKKC